MARQIPGPGRGVDGLSTVPGRAIAPYINWEELKRMFMLDPNYPRARTWLVNVMRWDRKKVLTGHTTKMTAGWSDEKAILERRKTDQAIEEMLKEQRKRIPELLKAKMNLVAQIMADVGGWGRLQPFEKKLCYEILKNELGEPTSTKVMVTGIARDPVEALLEEYGLMAEGRIIIDGEPIESREADSPAPAISSGSPAEVPQDQAL